MSRYGDRYGDRDRDRDRGDSRRHSSSRRDSSPPPRHRSRRSPSPGPSRRSPPKQRDPGSLPESFGRSQESDFQDDDLSVLQRMRSTYQNSPLQSLYEYTANKNKVKIWTRNYKEVRGVMTGYIHAFDKHWNIILSDVDEVFLKFKKNKTPFLRDIAPNENLPDMPAKVPKKKSAVKTETQPEPQPPSAEGAAAARKKRQRNKKPKAASEKRQLEMLFIRGDNIVLVSPAEEEDDDEDEPEEEQEIARGAG